MSGKLGQVLEGRHICCCRPLLRLICTVAVTVLHFGRRIPNAVLYIISTGHLHFYVLINEISAKPLS